MMNKKYLILLSTFNGEKYLSELLESLVKQQNAKCLIIVRDDGSIDQTLQILISFSGLLDIEVHVGENLGADASFKLLMKLALNRDFDYLAFCDQDDIWEPSKLQRAAEFIEKSQKSLYASKRKMVNYQGKYLRIFPSYEVVVDNKKSILENVCAGCTMVIKRQHFEEMMKLGLPEIRGSYDHILYNMSINLNEVIFDQESRIFYRIHSANAVGIRKKFKLPIENTSFELAAKIRTSLQINNVMGDYVNGQYREIINAIAKRSHIHKRILVFSKLPKLRQNWFDDIIIKIYLFVFQKEIISKL